MDARFAQAFLPMPQRWVLGRALRPLCLWHTFLFEALEIDLALAPQVIDFPTLVAAVRVASMPALVWKPGGFLDRLWIRHQTRRVFGRSAFAKATAGQAALWESERAAWAAWVAEGSVAPQFFETADGVPVKCPWQLFRVAQLCRFARYTAAEAWGMPLPQVQWVTAALAEANGAKIDLVSEEERAVMRAAGHDV